MKKSLHKYLIAIIGAIAMLIPFSSCTDSEDVEVMYDTQIVVGASHIFDGFQPVFPEDFTMDGYGLKWALGLHLFIYDKDGNLVEKDEQSGESMDFQIKHPITLAPGEYTLVAVAEFHSAKGNGNDFWSISGTEKLNDLKITESSSILSLAQGTLGLYTQTIVISDKPETINIDIPAVTALVVNTTWMEDYINPGDKGFSQYAPYVQNTKIFAENLAQSVTFEGAKPIFDSGNAGYRYIISSLSPKDQYRLNMNPRLASYRSLLPQNDKSLYWQITFVNKAGEQFGFTQDVLKSNMTNPVNIEAGKQYYTDLILDIMTLTFGEYDVKLDAQTRAERTVEQYKQYRKIEGAAQIDINSVPVDPDDSFSETNIAQALALDYDKWMGKSESEINSIMQGYSVMEEKEDMTYYWGKDLVNAIAVVYNDTKKESVKRVMLAWNCDTKSQYDKVSNYLRKKYTFFRDVPEDGYMQFINAPTINDATCGISWDSKNYCLFFDAIVHNGSKSRMHLPYLRRQRLVNPIR